MMTGIERMRNFLKRKPHDRIPIYEHFWKDTKQAWHAKGWIEADIDFADHFQFDMDQTRPFNIIADIDFKPEIVAETEETVLRRDGNGALLRSHKLHSGGLEHIDFIAKDRTGWEKHIKPHLFAEARRINFETYRKAKQHAQEKKRFLCLGAGHAFEKMKTVAGHEYMLMGMALDPEWVKDMVMTYADLYIGLQVIMHSCGFVEPLIPGMLQAGIDCLQAMEVKAGMDLLRIHRNYGDTLSLMGGIDVRALYSNDKNIIDHELESKIPFVKNRYGYALHSDHSIPNTVDYDTFCYFLDKGLSLGTY